MVKDIICPHCGGKLQPRGFVKRKIKLGNYDVKIIKIRRYSCVDCKRWQRQLLEELEPYKQYPKDIIKGFVNNILTTDDLNYELYPCDMTIKRWKNKKSK